ncbi:MAG: Y-family DNA polymerase [Chitinophagaceae bacterium]|jgi:DNA polymerase V|nr:Y-family DNA polymerase [Chitinophagaceae bacterium]MBK8301184.1 Y-family DNA polymerase [Chitinophagaceae bacterium]MBK9660859.1 Y-family DNA polymerase [Chitinophagaceae bacterium]MBP6232649.1 Y-family DNA polymerase [Chitinophagaceae bacterium]MBP6416102.1 Y-family DNA polymerase [Chitinophagaceae bacterium]
MKAIVDCNNFYCSCERLFKPKLDNKPVIVLSNNDGCIISRSNEAKKLGVEMAGPYFMAKPLIEKYNVAVFSSNYNLYGDLSWRVMETLRMMLGKDKVEVYSVDEAFLDLDIFPENEVQFVAEKIKDTVEQWTGIKVSVGVAPTKVLAKVANRLSKKKTEKYKGVMVLHNEEEIISALEQTQIDEVWGVGRQYAEKLKQHFCIYDALQLSRMSEEFGKVHLGGVVGSRLLRELKGITSKDMEDELINKKMIATTRMFGSPVGDITSIKEAVATYTSRAAEKLRRQHSAAKIISVFVVTKEENHQVSFNRGVTHSNYITLPAATSLTNELIKPAVSLVDKLYDPKKLYKKAGVMLSGIVPDNSIQANLFFPETKNCERKLMEMIDNVNFSQRDDVLKFAASGTERNWKMQQNFISGRHTTRWDELFEVY